MARIICPYCDSSTSEISILPDLKEMIEKINVHIRTFQSNNPIERKHMVRDMLTQQLLTVLANQTPTNKSIKGTLDSLEFDGEGEEYTFENYSLINDFLKQFKGKKIKITVEKYE